MIAEGLGDSLEFLVAGNLNLKDEIMDPLARGLKNVQSLTLERNQITIEGVKSLLRLIPKLGYLNVFHNPVKREQVERDALPLQPEGKTKQLKLVCSR